MDRRGFLKAAVGCLAGGVCLGAPGRTGKGRRPNILFILADDMGLMDSPLYGSAYYRTPALARLAERGMLFTNAYAASPLCSPTRASIMTGQYPARLGITTPACHLRPLPEGTPILAKQAGSHQAVVTPQSKRFLPLEAYTIGEAFRDAGYATGFIGKWHLGADSKYWPREQGFVYDLGAPNPGPPSYFSPYGFKTIPDGPKGEYLTDRMTEEAVKYLEAHREGPFLLCLWHFAVHGPFQCKPELAEPYRRRKDARGVQDCAVMASMIESMDTGIGRVLDTLDRLGIAEDTIIIFTSDNGGNMYDEVEGTTPTNNHPLRGGKGSIYEGGTRVPCIVVWPGTVKAGSRCDAVISSIDFYPTMLEMGGLRPRAGQVIDGVSLVPVLKGATTLGREAIFCHFPHYVPATQNRPSTSVRSGDWKLIRFYGEGPDGGAGYELYNLREDIGERKNLAAAMPERVRQLDRLIDGFIRETGAVVPVKNPAYRPPKRGWQGSGDCEVTVGPAGLSIRCTGGDPFIRTADVPIVSGPMVIAFRMKSQIRGGGAFFWTDGKVGGFSPKQRIDFVVRHDGRWHDYEIAFSARGRLTGLRIDPGTSAGSVMIERIVLRRKYGQVLRSWGGVQEVRRGD